MMNVNNNIMKGIKTLGFEEIKKRAEEFRKILKKIPQEFNINNPEAEKFLKENPLAPIIATICDQQIAAKDAWTFPYWLHNQLKGKGEFSAKFIYNLGTKKIKELLSLFMKDKWPHKMSEKDREEYKRKIPKYIIDTCKLIMDKYNNNPDNMFKNGKFITPEIYFILRSLPGVGPKKASMIARDFVEAKGPWYKGLQNRLKKEGIEFKVEKETLTEVPVDIHVVKVFGRVMGEYKKIPSRDKFLDYWPDIQNFAKLVFPDFPGKLDEILWLVGHEYCHNSSPNCEECLLKDIPCEYAKQRKMTH